MALGPRVIDWAVVSCDGDEEARYRVRRFALTSACGGSFLLHLKSESQSV
jgi:hypothetical protein